MIRFGILIIFTALIFAFTLSRPHRHRFCRFFAFISILGLALMNAPYWFRNPYAPIQVISWAFLACSILLVFHASRLLRIVGVPYGDFENTTRLVTVGAYRYIRHPIYCTLLLGGMGIFL